MPRPAKRLEDLDSKEQTPSQKFYEKMRQSKNVEMPERSNVTPVPIPMAGSAEAKRMPASAKYLQTLNAPVDQMAVEAGRLDLVYPRLRQGTSMAEMEAIADAIRRRLIWGDR